MSFSMENIRKAATATMAVMAIWFLLSTFKSFISLLWKALVVGIVAGALWLWPFGKKGDISKSASADIVDISSSDFDHGNESYRVKDDLNSYDEGYFLGHSTNGRSIS